MDLAEKAPLTLTKVSLFFSLINFFISGVNTSSIILFLVFTLSVYSTTRIFVAISQLQHATYTEKRSFYLHLLIVGLIFVGIASFSYSLIFGIFYSAIIAIYIISPHDRAWLAGKKKLVFVKNKVEYQDV